MTFLIIMLVILPVCAVLGVMAIQWLTYLGFKDAGMTDEDFEAYNKALAAGLGVKEERE